MSSYPGAVPDSDPLPLFLLFLAVIVAVMVVGFVLARRAHQRRVAAFTGWATARGWTYHERGQKLHQRWSGQPFESGSSRRSSHVLRGRHEGREVTCFDYQYETSSGTGENRTTTTHRFAVVACATGAALPELSVAPENMIGRFIGRITNRDIELESEDFNRAFTVISKDRKFASDVLHPQMMTMLLTRPDQGWRLERGDLLLIRDGVLELDRLDDDLAFADAILDRVPEFVWRDHGLAAPPTGRDRS